MKRTPFQNLVAQRRSIRRYRDQPVDRDKILTCIEAARLAPSASNRQRWKFVVVRDAKIRKELSLAAGGQAHIAEAPVAIAAVATMPEYIMRCGVPAYTVDLAIAVDHMTLAAVDEGLGTCWIGAFSQEEARAILKVPEHYRIVTLLPLGFPKQPGKTKERKSLDEIVCYDTFEE